jgi:hypothetical protein
MRIDAGLRIASALCVLFASTTPADAQGTLSDVIEFLMTNQAVATGAPERDKAAAAQASDTITRALLVNLTTVPIAATSGGFLYRLNPQLGTVERATQSFGAFFVERALTAGRGQASIGAAATVSSFNRLDGKELRDGTLITTANQFRDEPQPFDTESLTLRVRSSSVTLLGSVGVTDRLEIGAAVPFAQVTIDGERLNVYRGQPFVQATGTGTANGIADVALRAKYMFFSSREAGIAAAGEVRLPTGDEKNLLGAGSTGWRLTAVGSFERGPLSLHGNGGFGRGGISNELSFGAAVSYAPGSRVTLTGEMLARHVSELGHIALAAAPHPTSTDPPVDTLRLVAGESGTTLTRAVAGIKWNVAGTLVVGGHVQWALNSSGLTSALTPTVTVEYAH